MNEKIATGLERLTSLLPLKERQDGCSKEVRALHRQMLRSFVDQGRILASDEMVQHVSDPDAAIRTLQERDMVVFTADGTPVGAYPFTMEEREHVVRVNGHRVHAMCALDALAVSPMFGMETQVSSRCRVTGHPVHIQQSGYRILNLQETAAVHFGIAWGAAGSDSCIADSLCMEMIFLDSAETARQWHALNPADREIFTLQEAAEFGGRFFAPLLD
ncbi:MAG: alkylmercury lyase family protein [Thiohalobacterales bacterium]|nr:alkylmercury lyase family protein [Thiohalobacterales bacterium]